MKDPAPECFLGARADERPANGPLSLLCRNIHRWSLVYPHFLFYIIVGCKAGYSDSGSILSLSENAAMPSTSW